ncbi:MAG TPA: HU family DNA-binding protein [Hyphomonadaceae bacterium]|nr:HU family DNA-binding protein [Hyphomonadaceae bacterium]
MNKGGMNKTDLIRSIADSTGLKQSEATRLVDTVFDTITASLRKGEQVAISGFGTFVAKTRAAREGRNPSTGQPIHIAARTSAAFKPAAAMKDLK